MTNNPIQRNVTGGYANTIEESNIDIGADGRPVHKTQAESSFQQTLDTIDKKARTPDYYDAQVSSTMFWTVNRKGRKHVFIWLPTAMTLSFEDYGTGPVMAQVWFNVGIPDGTRCYATSVTGTTTYLKVCATDEVIP